MVVADADGNGRRELLIGSHYALFEFALDGVPDGIPRVGSVVRRDANPATSSSVAFTVTFTEPVTGVDTAPPFADFGIATAGVTGASITAVAGEGDTYTVTVSTGAGDGTIRLDVVDDDGVVAADGTPLGGAGAGNGDYAAGEVYDIWYNPRVASVVRADPDPTSSSAVHFTVTFSKPVTGVDTAPPFGDFAVRGTGAPTGTIAEVSGSGATYLVTVSVNAHGGNGTIRLDVRDDDSILDELGNRLGGAGAGNGAFTAGERYSVLTVPLPLAPRGRIADARPVYRWTAVPGATRYRYRALKGSKVLFTRIVEPGSCDEYAVCSDAPPQALGVGAHAWRVQAGIDDAWRSYSRSTSFTVSPKAGLWDGYAMEFHVTPGLGSVDDFAVYIYVAECGSYKITHTPRLRIADGRFGFGGPFYATGVFSGVENAAGRLGLRSLSIPGCGYVSGGPYAWSAVWKDSPPGIALAVEAEPAFITSLDEATPGDAAARGRFEVRVVPESAAGRP